MKKVKMWLTRLLLDKQTVREIIEYELGAVILETALKLKDEGRL